MQPTQHHDSDAEQAVLGAVLLDAHVLAHVPNVECDDFAIAVHGQIWAAIRNLEHEGKPIDLVTVGDELERVGRLKAPPGYGGDAGAELRGRCVATLGEAMLRCPTVDRVVEYAEILRRHRRTRDTIRALAGLMSAAQNGSLEGDELLAEASGELLRLSEDIGTEDQGKTVGRIVADECARIAVDDGREGAVTGMPTGLSKLDALTGGIPFAVTTLVLARPGHGKTTLVHNLAWCAAILGNDTPLVYSYEDGHASFAQRSIAQSSGVHTESIRARKFQRSDMEALAAARSRMLSRREVIVRAAGMSVDELIRDARARRIRGSQDGSSVGRLVIVDYVQKMPEPDARTRNERLGILSRKLSNFASKDDIAVIVCSQLNREVERRDDHIPRLEDARESGDLEQDCKLALGLYRPAKYSARATGQDDGPLAPDSLLEIHVLKNHNGQTDCCASVYWDLATHTICDSANDLRARREMGGSDANRN